MASPIVNGHCERAQAEAHVEYLSDLLTEIEQERNQVQAIAIAGAEYASRTEEHSTERYLFEALRRLSEDSATLLATRDAITRLNEFLPAEEKTDFSARGKENRHA